MNYYEQIYANKLDNLEEMKKSLRNTYMNKMDSERNRKFE